MKILIVAATWNEVKPLEQQLVEWDCDGKLKQHAVEIAVTGPGLMHTAFQLGKILAPGNWDLAINMGICGSFKKEIPVGTTVNIVEDCLADFGAEDDESFLSAFEIGLIDKDKFPFENGKLVNKKIPGLKSTASLQQVKAITVNTVHGNEHAIAKTMARYSPDVESMEGAAFMFACMKDSIPFLQLRTVSNLVEKRDKEKWNIPLAIERINKAVMAIVDEMITAADS